MRLDQLQAQVEKLHRAPTERWNPEFCGDIDIEIKRSGEWFYGGSKISRPQLVRLFASVLRHENNEYFLVTPAEKVRIRVEDLPFVIVGWKLVENDGLTWLQVETNIGEQYLVSEQHPVVSVAELPAVQIRDHLLARVHRNVYYQWADRLESAKPSEAPGFYLVSGTERFLLGEVDS